MKEVFIKIEFKQIWMKDLYWRVEKGFSAMVILLGNILIWDKMSERYIPWTILYAALLFYVISFVFSLTVLDEYANWWQLV